MASAAVEYSRYDTFVNTPTVLIQDPSAERAYLIDALHLVRFETNPSTWATMKLNTVTFSLPEAGLVERVPPFSRAVQERPDVLLQWRSQRKSFLIPASALDQFEVDLDGREKGDGYDVSFVIPRGTEFIERLPSLRRSILQSGESVIDF